MKENLDSLKVTLSPEEVEEIRQFAKAADAASGPRYPERLQGFLFVDTPPLQK